jgi:hypothetical protein
METVHHWPLSFKKYKNKMALATICQFFIITSVFVTVCSFSQVQKKKNRNCSMLMLGAVTLSNMKLKSHLKSTLPSIVLLYFMVLEKISIKVIYYLNDIFKTKFLNVLETIRKF